MTNILTLSLKNKKSTVLFFIIATCFFAFGLQYIQVETNADNLIAKDSAEKILYDKTVEEFGSDQQTVIFIKDKNLFTPDKLIALETMQEEFYQLAFVNDIDSLFTVKNIHAVDGMLETGPVFNDIPDSQIEIDSIVKKALHSPILRRNLISEDATTTAINLNTTVELGNVTQQLSAYRAIQNIINKYSFENIFQFGPPRFNHDILNTIKQDFKVLGLAGILLFCGALYIIQRSMVAVLLPLISCALTFVWTFGSMGYLGIPINMLSSMLPTLMLVIGSTEDMHLFSAYKYAIRTKKNFEMKSVAELTLMHVGLSIALAVFTTWLGFFSNTFSSIKLISDFAYAASLSILCNGLITLFLMPIIISLFKINGDDKTFSFVKNVTKRLNIVRQNHEKTILLLATIVIISSIYLSSKIIPNNSYLSFFYSSHPIVQNNEQLTENLSGGKILYIAVDSKVNNYFKNTQGLNKLLEIENILKARGKFDHWLSIADFIAYSHQEMNDGQSAFYKIPDNPNLIAQYLLFIQADDVTSFINEDYSKANIIIRHNIHNNVPLARELQFLNKELEQVSGSELDINITGKIVLLNEASIQMTHDQIWSIITIIITLSFVFALLFKPTKSIVLILFVNIMPLICVFGIMGLLGIPLNPATVIVAVIVIGIAVDDTTHLLIRYTQNISQGTDLLTNLNKTVEDEFLPIFTTSTALIVGFCSLGLSNFTVIRDFGVLLAIGIGVAVIVDLLITPLFLKNKKISIRFLSS